MDCTCDVDKRRLTPGVFNLKQYLNNTETMKWRLTSHFTNNGDCDLRNYDAFLVLSVSGRVDEILLTKTMIDVDEDGTNETLELAWNVGTYATELQGHVKYQIIFRSNQCGKLGVIGSADANANGCYNVVSAIAEGNARVWEHETSDYQIKWDNWDSRWALYEDDGTTVVDYQTFPSTEPFCGTWGTVAVGNTTAAVWFSDEAIMYISDTVAADQSISANFPTVLRQVWEAVRYLVVRSGCSIVEKTISVSDWQVVAGELPKIEFSSLITTNTGGAKIVSAVLLDTSGNQVDNTSVNYTYAGGTIRALSAIDGKILFTVKGGNEISSYSVITINDNAAATDSCYSSQKVEDLIDNLSPAVTSVAGKTGDVTLEKADVGLGNVDNTSDTNKPISTAVQTALDGKVNVDGEKVLSDNNYSALDKSCVDDLKLIYTKNTNNSIFKRWGAKIAFLKPSNLVKGVINLIAANDDTPAGIDENRISISNVESTYNPKGIGLEIASTDDGTATGNLDGKFIVSIGDISEETNRKMIMDKDGLNVKLPITNDVTPTANAHLANKKYVDDGLATVQGNNPVLQQVQMTNTSGALSFPDVTHQLYTGVISTATSSLTLPTVTVGLYYSFSLDIYVSAETTMTFPSVIGSDITWAGGTLPSMDVGNRYVIDLYYNGSTWYGSYSEFTSTVLPV